MAHQLSIFTEQARNEALKSIYDHIEKSIERDRVKVIKMKANDTWKPL